MIDPRDPRLIAGVIGAILVVVAVSVWFVYDQTFVELYWREIAGPRVETELGFRLEYVPTEIPGREHMYVITQVTPGGRFDRAGIEPGDTLPHWIGYASRLDWFYSHLSDPTQQPLKLRVVNVRHAGLWPKHVREVTIPSARATPNSALQRTSARSHVFLLFTFLAWAEAAELGTLGGRTTTVA